MNSNRVRVEPLADAPGRKAERRDALAARADRFLRRWIADYRILPTRNMAI